MTATDIISIILQRYKVLCARYSKSPSFISNTKGDSFYLIRKNNKTNHPIQIRLSNHGTYLSNWTDMEELGNSVERLDPSLCTNISIVFVDDGSGMTKDCKGMTNCDGCNVQPCIPQTFEGQNEKGRPFQVVQYTYSSKQIASRYIKGLTKAIAEASVNGKYKDPLVNLAKAAKVKPFSPLDNTDELPF